MAILLLAQAFLEIAAATCSVRQQPVWYNCSILEQSKS
jgi:hypothetical protein